MHWRKTSAFLILVFGRHTIFRTFSSKSNAYDLIADELRFIEIPVTHSQRELVLTASANSVFSDCQLHFYGLFRTAIHNTLTKPEKTLLPINFCELAIVEKKLLFSIQYLRLLMSNKFFLTSLVYNKVLLFKINLVAVFQTETMAEFLCLAKQKTYISTTNNLFEKRWKINGKRNA